MRYTSFKRPAVYVPLGILVVLGVLSAIVFNPGLQKKAVLERVGPLVDSLEIGYIHATPWSLTLDEVNVGYGGGTFHLETGRARYGLASLILKKINLKSLSLRGVRVDLTDFDPPAAADEEATAPFPGLLASLDQGFSYVVGEIDVDAEVLLPAAKSVTATLTGGGIRPEASGSLGLDVRYDMGTGADHVALDGTLRLDQLTRGRFSAVEAALAIRAALASLPEAEHLAVSLSVSPAPGENDLPAATNASDEGLLYAFESIELSVDQNDKEGANRSTIALAGIYDGNDGSFAGDYRVTANEQLVQPYAAGKVIAPARETLSGKLALNVASLTGSMSVLSELQVTDIRETYANEQLPEQFQMQNNFRISLLPDQRLRIDRLETALSHGDDVRTLTSNLTNDQNIPLNDIDAFLHQENTLLVFELPAVPLAWLNVFLPDYEITDGTLSGAFTLTTDATGAIHVKPQRPLELAGLNVDKAGMTLLSGMNATVLPSVTYTGESLNIALEALEVRAGQDVLVTADTTATLPLSGTQSGSLDASARARLHMHTLADFLGAEPNGRLTMPEILVLDFKAGLLQGADSMQVSGFDADLSTSNGDRLVSMALLQSLVIEDTADGPRVASPAGDLATFNVSDVDLDWFSAFVPGGAVKGMLRRADFAMAVDGNGTISVTPDRPFRMDGVTVATRDSPLTDDLGIRISPVVRIAADSIEMRYEDLELTGDGVALITGSGTVSLPRMADGALVAEGRVDVDIQGLTRQPIVAGLLQARLNAPVRLEADYSLSQRGDVVDVRRLEASVFYSDAQPKITLLADSGIRVRTRLAADRAVAGQASGELTLGITDLTAAPFADILAARGLSFATVNGKAVLSSDGTTMHVTTDGPFEIAGIAVRSKDAVLLEPFAVTVDTDVDIDGDTLSATLNRYSVTFSGAGNRPAVEGNAELELSGKGETVRLLSLAADVSIALPALLGQPALLPGNTLTAGKVKAVVSLAPDGRLDSTILLDGLKARSALALQTIETTVTGTVDPDGGFALTAPVRTTGKSGVGNLEVQAQRKGETNEDQGLSITATSDVLYLNDILNTVNAIAGRQPSAVAGDDAVVSDAGPQAGESVQIDERRPDLQPFWTGAGDGLRLSVDIGRLFYTDYLEINGLAAQAEILPERIALESLRASFHDSPIAVGGTLSFTPGPAPYDLNLQGTIDQLDMATFLRELAPGAKPRAEGLFDFRIDAFGQSPNMPQYRNDLFFDVTIQGRNGIFRLLNPDSAIVAGSTGVSGAAGEVVSYVPTGLFGLGAVPRLVSYIKDVEYDKIDIQLVRDESRNVQIRRYVVQSPEVLLTASGGIEYQEGVDILQSPLTLDARLDMRGVGAAIMHDMDLLQPERNPWNYWKGPEIRFRGTPAATESNLSEIISQAGKGMVLGGLTRPFSGLVGNARHRWSRNKGEPLEYDGSSEDGAPSDDAQPEQVHESP